MPLISMTGFGRGEAAAGGVRAEVELSAVNRKQLDVRVNLPRGLLSLDSLVYARVHEAVARGNVTGNVKLSMTGRAASAAVGVDEELAAATVRRLRTAAQRLGLRDDLSARMLLQMPDVIRRTLPDEDASRAWPLVAEALAAALRDLNAMRRREGAALEKDLRRQFAALKRHLAVIRKRAPAVPAHYRKVLLARIREAGVPVDGKDPQLLKEVALMADRCDIGEEIVRLDSHFDQAAGFMAAAKPVGRSMDFLCQEMFREINTIGSKANDHVISRHVVHFKAALECVREQVQNVE